MQRGIDLEDPRKCRLCSAAVVELDVFSSAVAARFGQVVCEGCACKSEAIAELCDVERPTLDNLAAGLDVGTDQVVRLTLALAHLGYYPWEAARRFATETSAGELVGLRGLEQGTVDALQAKLATHGLELRADDAPMRWPAPAQGGGLKLQPRAGLNVGRVCAAMGGLEGAVERAAHRYGAAATLAALLESERTLRQYEGGRQGQAFEAAVHIESRELASLHAGLHQQEEESNVSDRQS